MAEPIFTPQDLSNWLQYPVKEASAVLAEQVAQGWLLEAMQVPVLPPAPKGSSLFSSALELGGIAYENPLSLTSGSLGDEASNYDRTRRDRILTAVASSARGRGPVGCFPSPADYPDPAQLPPAVRHRW